MRGARVARSARGYVLRMEPGTPASWQPDPTGRHEHRYWDGQVWTDTVSDAGSTAVDAYEVAAPTPVVAPTVEPQPAPAAPVAPTAATVPTPSPVPAASPAVERLGPDAKSHVAVGGSLVSMVVVGVIAIIAVIEILLLVLS